jgi:hypothetical protein
VVGEGRRRTGWWLVGVLAVAVVVALVGLVLTATSSPSAARPAPPTAAPTGTTTVPPPTGPAPVPTTAAPATRTPSAAEQAAAQQELAAVVADLPALALRSPAGWDAWGPEGKPYPGADTADDLSTCPVVSARVGAALGVGMSYWVGTLPGPTGCSYATTPLQAGGDPYTYAYTLRVSFTADGSTPQSLRTQQFQLQGQVCPSVDAPSVAPGAVLVGCTAAADFPGYVLLLPDRRTTGTWSIQVNTRPNAEHTTEEALRVFVEALAGVYR